MNLLNPGRMYATISKIENGFTISLDYSKGEDYDRKEYAYPSLEEAIGKAVQYFNDPPTE